MYSNSRMINTMYLNYTSFVDVHPHIHQPTLSESRLLKGRQYCSWTYFDRALNYYEARAGWSFKRVGGNTDRLIVKCWAYDKDNPESYRAELYVKHLKGSTSMPKRT